MEAKEAKQTWTIVQGLGNATTFICGDLLGASGGAVLDKLFIVQVCDNFDVEIYSDAETT